VLCCRYFELLATYLKNSSMKPTKEKQQQAKYGLKINAEATNG